MRLASTWVSHWPLVMASTMSKTLSTRMVIVVHTTTMVRHDLRHHDPQEDLEGTGAVDDGGLDRLLRHAAQRAPRMTMAKPVWIQIRITIRKKLFQNGMEIHTCGSPPNQLTMALRMPICVLALAAIVVDEFPDHAGADEGDRQRQEDQALGDVAPPDAVGQHGDDQAEEGAGGRHHEQPQQIVEDRLAELRVVDSPGIVGDADEGRRPPCRGTTARSSGTPDR